MRINCLGGGPAGLYFAILAKRADPAHDIVVVERHHPEDSFGWGIVFSDRTLDTLLQADPPSHAEITRRFHHWSDIDIHFKGECVTAHGHGFSGISRARLIRILQARAEALGVTVRNGVDFAACPSRSDCDLVVGADGIHSTVRGLQTAAFAPTIRESSNRYLWLGSTRLFAAFTFAFRETPHGWFNLHAYRFDDRTSSCIVETPEAVWREAGLDRLSYEESIAFCERLFADVLDGEPLIGNSRRQEHPSGWQRFASISCRRWWHDRTVLIGDAAHTAHFSVGSGTRLAMEDAIELARSLAAHPADLAAALARYQAVREAVAQRVQETGFRRMEWFENVADHARLSPAEFACALLTSSGRLDHEELRRRDPELMQRMAPRTPQGDN
ncbi:MAG: FAD-dependent monooxygenase [Gammaproteobacteria bacterium]|nr:FAD-dependent monooxygenase [Gammaproteobacteria bacterium]MBU1646072.1 FAD-dependent monooxygenase [Gammaproteobacteria bacterium]MBU1972134.1 FAD-dependent monooxygenase [Gammaproteobacteria bacterium]